MQHLVQRFAAKMKGDGTGEVFSAVTGALFMISGPRGLWEFIVRATGSHGWILSKLGNNNKAKSRKNS